MHGRYCHVCGQENIEPKESFWHLVTHFVYDVTHFDGKFFSTLKYLLFRPGFLSSEYLIGRRASYLHPIRMYVFTSAFFFLIFFSLNKDEDMTYKEKRVTAATQMHRLLESRERVLEALNDTDKTDIGRRLAQRSLATIDTDIVRLKADTMYKTHVKSLKKGTDFNRNFNVFSNPKDSAYRTVDDYELAQSKLPESERDGFFTRRFTRQKLYLNEKYDNDGQKIWEVIIDKFKHSFPQMLFLSLPLFALMLQLMYLRKKSMYYVNHVVFTIHLYCGTFIIILVGMLIDLLCKKLNYTGGWDGLFFTLAFFFFWYKSMRNFYRQRRAKTILKFILLNIISIVFMTLLFILFFAFSAMAV